MRHHHLLSLILILFAATSRAQSRRGTPAPETTSSIPAAAAPGATTDVTFFNPPPGKPTGLWTSFPAEVTPLPSGSKGTAAVRYRLKLPPNAPVGIGAVRVATSGGLSNLQLFMVDDLPSVARNGTNHSPADAQVIPPLCAIDGTAEPLGSDYYRCSAKRGQRVAFEIVAQRLGSRMDPLVRILDSTGRELAYCDDTPGLGADSRFAHTFAADGDYLVELRDANYEGSSDHRYRLRVGDFPVVTVPLPLGAKAGTDARFECLGPDGDKVGPVSLKLPSDAPRAQFGVKYPGGQSSAFVAVLCGERDEFVAKASNHTPETAAPVSLPASISGRFTASGTRDFYEFAAKKGQRIVLRGRTRSLGSPIDLFFQVFKPGGGLLAESKIVEPKPATKGALPPPPDEGTLDVSIPADGTYRLSVEDLNRAGGPAMVYHLDVERAAPDFTLSVETDKVEVAAGGTFRLKVKADRHGYDGPITLSLGGAAADFALKKNTIPARKAEVDLEVTVPASVATIGRPTQFTVIGKGNAPATGDHTASTLPAIRRLFTRMTFVPPELDGPIGLLVRPAPATPAD